jgi:hypothetical protein
MEDGTLIPFDFDFISNPKHVTELDRQNATKYEVLMVAKNMSNMEQRIVSVLDDKFKNMDRKLSSHNSACPINKPEIQSMIETTIAKQPKIFFGKIKRTWIIIAGLVAAMTVIADLIITVGKIFGSK